jgi:hypothetical protein
MKLKLANRTEALIRLTFILVIVFTIGFISKDRLTILIISSIFLLIGIIVFVKNNVSKAVLEGDNIIVSFNWRKISIPIRDIKSINSALNRGNALKGLLSTIFIVELKRRYPFGFKLLLDFEHKELPIQEPIEIATLKAAMKYNANEK